MLVDLIFTIQLKMNNALRHIAYLSIWTFTVIVVWITLSVYLQSVEVKTPAEILEASTPLQPSFDRPALDALEDRVAVPINLSAPGVNFTPDPTIPISGELIEDEIIISP